MIAMPVLWLYSAACDIYLWGEIGVLCAQIGLQRVILTVRLYIKVQWPGELLLGLLLLLPTDKSNKQISKLWPILYYVILWRSAWHRLKAWFLLYCRPIEAN